MPKSNLELFKTLNLHFAYIHSKRRKLSMFILYQKCLFIYPNKVNSPPIRSPMSFIFSFWSRDKWPEINVKAQEDPRIYF